MSRMASKRLRILRCHAAKARGSLRSKKTSPITSQNSPWWAVVDEIVVHPHRQIVRAPREHRPEADELTVNLRSTIVLDFETSQLREQRRNVSGEFIAAVRCDPRQRRCVERFWPATPAPTRGMPRSCCAFVTISSRIAARASSSSAQASSSAKVSSSSPYQYIIEATSCAVRGVNTG